MRKRSKHQARVILNPVQVAVERATPISGPSLDSLRLRELAAIDAFARGLAGGEEWFDVNSMVSICETMALGGAGPEALDACRRAEDALLECRLRYNKTGKIGSTTGPGLQAFREVYEFHDLQRTSVSQREYLRFIADTTARAKSRGANVTVI